MVHWAPRRSLRTRLLGLQLAIVLGLVTAVAAVVLVFEDNRTRALAAERVHTVAVETAGQRIVRDHLDREDAVEFIAPIARLAEQVSGVDFVVVVNLDNIRVAHPQPEQIGQPVSSDHEAVRAGESFVGTEEGPLGVTLRAKEPVVRDGRVIGTVSVGILQGKVRAELLEGVGGFAPWILGAAALGTVASAWAARTVRRRIYGVEPEDVAGLLQSQQALLFSVNDGVLGVDTRGRVTLANAEAVRLLGLEGDVVGRPAADVLDPHVHALLNSEGPGAEDTQYVLAGERVLVATRREAVSGDATVGRTLTLQDRTEMESTLRELEGQRGLAEALRSQTHEFANRLHVIDGYLSVGATELAAAYVRRITGEVDPSAARMVDDPALSGLLGAQAAVAREAGVRLEVDAGSSTSSGWTADDDSLTVTGNLLSNAIEAAGDGGAVRILIGADPGGVRIRVEDSGAGIAADDVDRIFLRGYSSKGPEAGTGSGRGVGLALVDRIIRRRGGSVDVGRSPFGGASIDVAWGRPFAAGGDEPHRVGE